MNKRAIKAAAQNKLTMGPVKQRSGELVFVPFYSDNRRLFSHPKLLKVIAEECAKIVLDLKKKGLKIDCIAGTPNIGVPLAYAISSITGIKAVYIEKKRKKFLHRTYVQGDFKRGENAVLVDDIMGEGETKNLMIKNAKKDGLNIKHIICMANAWPKVNKKTLDKFTQQGIGFSCLFTRDNLMAYLIKIKRIPKEILRVHQAYAENPAGWVKNKQIYNLFLKWKKQVGVKTGETF